MDQIYKQFLSLQITSLPTLRLQPQPIQQNSLEILSNIIQDIYKLDPLMNDTVFEYFKEVLNCERDFNLLLPALQVLEKMAYYAAKSNFPLQ